MRKKLWGVKQVTSTDMAIGYARRLIEEETRGTGDLESAMYRLEAKTGIGYWTLWGLWNKRRKQVDADLFTRIRGAYYAACERQLSRLQHDLAIEKALNADDDFEDLVLEAQSLAKRLRLAKEKRGLLVEHDASDQGGG